MAKVNLLADWGFVLDPVETRIMLKALGGRLNSLQEVEAAKALGDQLTIERAKAADHFAEEMDKHAAAAEGLRAPANEPTRNPRNTKQAG